MDPRPSQSEHPQAATVACFSCQLDVVPVRPVWAWRLLLVPAWSSMFIPFGLFLTPLGLFALPLLPVMILLLGGLFGPLHERAFARPSCPHCGRELPAAEALAGAQTPAAARRAAATAG